MFQFFDMIFDYIQLIWSFFLNLVKGIFSAVQVLSSSLSSAFFLSGSVPWFLTSSFIICIFIVIVNYLIGRDNS